MGQGNRLFTVVLLIFILRSIATVFFDRLNLFNCKTMLADFGNNNRGRHKQHRGDYYYVVDSGTCFHHPMYNGGQKPERDMIDKIITWLWWFPGIPAVVISVCAFVLEWIHLTDVKSFITIAVMLITGATKFIVTWAEKGDIVKAKWRKLITKRKQIKNRRP
jgi:hypothetical protein